MKHGFTLRFAKSFDYVFKSKSDAFKAMRKIQEGIRKSGLTRADYHMEIKKGVKKGKGRGMRVLKGGKRA